MIPDTFMGGLALSLLDFFTSFFFIAFIGIVLKCLPIINSFGNNK